jgi:anti-sigma factor RsiW
MDTPGDKQENREPSGLSDLDGHVDDWAELAVDYVDGVLPQKTRLAVEEHIRTCSSCAARLQTQRRVADLLEAVEYVDPPSDLSDRIREQLLFPVKPLPVPGREPKPHPLSWGRRLRPWIPVTVAVAAVLIGVVAYGLIRNQPGYYSAEVAQSTTTSTARGAADSSGKGLGAAPGATAAQGPTSAGVSTTAGTPTTAAAAVTTVASASSVTMTESSVPPNAIRDKAMVVNTLKSTNGPAYLTLGGAAGSGPVNNNSAPSSTTSTSAGSPPDESATEQLDQKAALVTAMTTLQPLSSDLWLGGPTFAAFLRQKDAAPLVDLLNSMGMTVTLESEPPESMAQIATQILGLRPELPILASELTPQPAVNRNTFTTSTLAPADQSGGTPAALPDEGGPYVLIILVVTL